MVILSLDVSTNSTGYCVYDTDRKSLKAKIKEYDTISLPSNRLFQEKKYNFNNKMEELIIKYRPDIILREELITNVKGMSNKRAIISMGSFHKDLEMIAWKYDIEVIDIYIKDIKVALLLDYTIKIPRGIKKAERNRLNDLKRKEKKDNTIEKINELYKLNLDNDDIADSFSVLYTYLGGV